jgi:hypothetical protein
MINRFLFIAATVFSVLFILTAWVWTYWLNLFISLPSGIIGFILFLYYRSRYGMDRGAVIIARVLTLGLIIVLITGGVVMFNRLT